MAESDQGRSVQEIERERREAHRARDREAECQLWLELSSTWLLRDDLRRGLDAARKGLALAEKLIDPALEGRALGCLGAIYMEQGKADRAVVVLARSTALMRQADALHGLATYLLLQGHAHAALGENELARACMRESLTLAVDLDAPELLAGAARALALSDLDDDRAGDSLGELRRAISVYRELDDLEALAEALCHEGRALADLGRWEEASVSCEEAFSLAHLISPELRYGALTGLWSAVQTSLGQPERALPHVVAAIEASESFENGPLQATVLLSAGELYMRLDQPREGLDAVERAQAIARREQLLEFDVPIASLLADTLASLGRFEEAIPEAQRALDLLTEPDSTEHRDRMIDVLALCYRETDRHDLAGALYDRRRLEAQSSGSLREEMVSEVGLGDALFDASKHGQAIPHYERACELAEQLGDRRMLQQGRGILGAAYDFVYDYAKSRPLYEALLADARADGERWAEGLWSSTLANACYKLGDLERAAELGAAALTIADELQVADFGVTGCWVAAHALQDLERLEESLRLHQRCLVYARDERDLWQQAEALGEMAWIKSRLERYRAAIRDARQAIRICQRLDEPQIEAAAWETLADCYERQKKPTRVIEALEESIALYRDLDEDKDVMRLLARMGHVLSLCDEHQQAIDAVLEAIVCAEGLGDDKGSCALHARLSVVYRYAGAFDEALESARDALAIAQDLDERALVAIAEAALGRAYGEMSEVEQAVSHLSRAVEAASGLELGDSEVRMRFDLAGELHALGHKEDALAEAKKALALAAEGDATWRNEVADWLQEQDDSDTPETR